MEVDETDREYLEREINSATMKNIDRLFDLWKMIGVKNLRENRVDTVLDHIEKLYATMVSEEESNLDKITKNIQRYDRERMELRLDLGVTECDDENEAELSLVDVEFKIRTEVFKLREKKAERMKVFNDERAIEKALCEATGSPPCDIVLERLPSDSHLRQIAKHINHLRQLRSKREDNFEKTARKIRELYEKLETEPRNSKERNLVCSNIGDLVLSEDTMDFIELILQGLETEVLSNEQAAEEIIESIVHISEKLNLPYDAGSKKRELYSSKYINELRDELTCLEEERRKHMSLFIKSAASDLEQIWEQCYAGEDTKSTFKSILDTKDDDEEAILNLYESNVKAWKSFYDDHHFIINKIDEWYSLWADRLQLETSMKDPSRLGNFKALREEEKRRNRVNKRLPKIVDEIYKMTSDYLDAKGKDFLIRGMTFNDLNDYQQNKHDIEVQREKEKKKQEKKKLMVQESIYGVGKTVAKTPVRGNRTLRQVKRLQHESRLVPGSSNPGGGKSFATPGKPIGASTPGGLAGKRRALRERNDTFVSGSRMVKDSIASVNDNIFNQAEMISSTLKPEQFVSTQRR